MSPPTWQHSPRLVGTSRIVTSEAGSIVLSSRTVNRPSLLEPLNGANCAAVPVDGASPPGVLNGGA
jgi:hypothetical protein